MYIMDIYSSVKELKGVGEVLEKNLAKLGIFNINDLLNYFPYNYEKFNIPDKVADIPDKCMEDEICVLNLRLISRPQIAYAGKYKIVTAIGQDDSGRVELRWFGETYLTKILFQGSTYIFRGKFTTRQGKYIFSQPKVFTVDDYEKIKGTIQPIYALTKKITEKQLRKLMAQAIEKISCKEDYLEKLCDSLENTELNNFISKKKAIAGMHFPADEKEAMQARKRLVFDEFLSFIMSIRLMKTGSGKKKNKCPIKDFSVCDKIIDNLNFELTGAQKKVITEIQQNMSGKFAMNRLVQGDVGSGKTIVAFLAMLAAADNGFQSVIMAPTEVLARQHYEELVKLLSDNNLEFECVLLCGSMTAKQKKTAKEALASGRALLAVGTHALIQEDVEFKNLALAVTDEQHRFGVKQRACLSDNKAAEDTEAASHVLVMSATPIPRTLAIIIYGDLDISIINELPAQRLPIKNCVVGSSFRKKAYSFIEEQVKQGHQAMIICPMVSFSEVFEAENVIDYTAKLREELSSNIKIEYLHGKLKNAEKNDIMNRFAMGEIDVLVSTTVIEVGINVPNTTIIMIENSERFGLAQLHQLRGRVGRGAFQSYCIFMCSSEKTDKISRLNVLAKSNDGFVIAEEDLKQRGAGDMFGVRQSGDMSFRLGDIYQDAAILKLASEIADRVLEMSSFDNQGEFKALYDEIKLRNFGNTGINL